MSYSEILVVYLCALTLYPVFYALPILINIGTRKLKRPLSRGEIGYIVLRLLVFFFVAVLGWVLYFFTRFDWLVIPITAFLDFGGMFVMMLSAKRLIQCFDAKHAA
jgi:hypothetical protein